MDDFLLLSDPRVAAMPVAECGEALVDLRHYPALVVDPGQADHAGCYAQARQGAADRLVTAAGLLPAGWQLVVLEAYRTPHLQQQYFDAYVDFLVSRNPAWSWPKLREQASRYVSPPEVAPHTSGGAVDVTATAGGRPVWMGTEVNASPEQSDGACFTAAAGISGPARRHRDLLGQAMRGAGFVNYPTEWWHWSYGDRYWAQACGAPAARYGAVVTGLVRDR